ncbi:MAG: CAP domain-containing protein [Dehalococcoidia bacterium]
MAGFESAHGIGVGEAVREWRPGRFGPLYAAGILSGIAVGLGIALWPAGNPAVEDHVASFAPAGQDVPAIVATLPQVASPADSAGLPGLQPGSVAFEISPDLLPPVEIVPVAADPAAPVESAPAVPVAPPVAPAAPAAPAVPVAPAAANPPQPVAPAAPAAPPAVETKPNFYVPAVSSGPATSMELQLLDFINAERANAGLAPYVLDSGLTKIARTRSQQLIDQNYFGHRDPYGYSMYVELLAYFGYTSYAWAGENLAMNNWPADTAANEAIHGLMNSPTHKANILATDFTRIGVGEITAANGKHYFTMIFLS